jgi:predicted RecA/RadA family phage recombinase/Flp pilus assembly protein TadG
MPSWRFRSINPARLCGAAMRRLRELAADKSGTVAIIVGFSIIPLIGAVGIATDTSRGYLVKSRLQSAVDSAALAGGRVFASANRDADIQQYFAANFPNGYMDATVTPLTITPDNVNQKVTLTAQATMPTTFMRLLGSDSITVKAAAEVTRQTSRLQVVLAVDMSGSMNWDVAGHTTFNDADRRIYAAREASKTLVNILFGSNATNDLLKIGLVPWAAKVNVSYNGTTYGYDSMGNPLASGLYTIVPVTSYTHPVPLFTNPAPSYQVSSANSAHNWEYASPNANTSRSYLYYAHNSPVPLTDPPPVGWTGCVYSRFAGDTGTAADEILVSGAEANNSVWPGWVPTGANIATRTAPYNVSSGSGLLVSGLFGVAVSVPGGGSFPVSSGSAVNMQISGTFTLTKKTSQSWSSGASIYWDNTNKRTTTSSSGNTYIGTAASSATSSATTGSVKLKVGGNGEPQSGTNDTSNTSPNNVCLDTHADANSTSANGGFGWGAWNRTADCSPCPTPGITAMQSSKATMINAINGLTIPNAPSGTNYYTNLPAGLAWAWEVLDQNAPFTEGVITDGTGTPPRAIVLLTDGENTCSVGDAYQNYSSGGCQDWRDQRLRDIATNIKAQDVLIYAIQFAEPVNADLLQDVASKDTAPFYYYAPTAAELQNAFTEIANNLSNLRLSR